MRLTVAEALALLPEGDGDVHVFSCPRDNMLIGTDMSRERIISLVNLAQFRELAGPAARATGHRLVLLGLAQFRTLFIQTRPEATPPGGDAHERN